MACINTNRLCAIADTRRSNAHSTDSQSVSQLKEATAIRTKEVATFEAAEKELVDATEILGRAVGILEKEMTKSPAGLMQVDTSNVNSMIKGLAAVISSASFSTADQAKLTALVQQQSGADDEELGAPAAAVYSVVVIFDSGPLVSP